MGSFSTLGIGLSFIFGCILMGIVAELYYLLWWKKRIVTKPTKIEDFSFLFCWKRVNSNTNQESTNPSEHQDLEVGSSKNLGFSKGEEVGVDLELMRLHNLCGPPRFLFSITEESKEDMESEDGRSRKGMNATPLSSPSPAISASYNSHGFNPLFESITEAEVNRLRSSPPPTFKFLKDAEDKLIRKQLMEEGERKRADQEIAGFVKLSNQSAQVLPLSSSPTVQ